MRILVIGTLLLLSIVGCKNKKEVVKNENKLADQEVEVVEEKLQMEEPSVEPVKINFPQDAVARIQRTACFGRCPIYTLTVYEDGTVIYKAEEWVEKKGTFQAKTDPKTFVDLLKKAEEIGYFEMKNEYDSQSVTDLPSVITTLRSDEKLKQIVNRYQGPQELREFEEYFDSLYLKLNWSMQDE